MEKRLYKSSTNKILAGVCGGIGEYFDIDPVLVRVVWVISAFFGGAGILAYIIAAIVIPSPEDRYGSRAYQSASRPAGTVKPKAEASGETPAEGAQEGEEGTVTEEVPEEERQVPYARRRDDSGRMLGGIILVVLGGIFLLRELMPWIDGGLIVAACFIALGVYFLVRKNGEQQ